MYRYRKFRTRSVKKARRVLKIQIVPLTVDGQKDRFERKFRQGGKDLFAVQRVPRDVIKTPFLAL